MVVGDESIFESLSTCSTVDPKRLKLYYKLLGHRQVDALYHFPSNLSKRRFIQSICEAAPNEIITILGHAVEYATSYSGRGPSKIYCSDGDDIFQVIYFRGNFSYQQKCLPLNVKKTITGKVEKNSDGDYQIIHPDLNLPYSKDHSPMIEPVYPLTTGLTNRCVSRVVQSLVPSFPSLPEWIPPSFLQKFSWPSWQDALKIVHNPKNFEDLLPTHPARERLIFDELLAHQLSLTLVRSAQTAEKKGHVLTGTGVLIEKLRGCLPFSLTPSQETVIKEIFRDMESPTPMLRLLQGDVGSGKTIVAFLAMIKAVESGFQAAILAPTDILAHQHRETFQAFSTDLGLEVTLLTGRDKGKKRAKILEDLATHKIHILIGTHALIQKDVVFSKLGLAIIDEQHRFGVEQRLALLEKGNNPHILAMTATPIPRTLQLANHGEMDVSILKEKPSGRLPTTTTVTSLQKLNEIIEGLRRPLSLKTKIFWVCPLVEESEVSDLSAAQERYTHLQSLFGEKVGLVHGRLKAADKDKVMEDFITGSVDILIATTVIEVGVNVPAATIMIIEHAEHFGLAQLHQLRGRIGRGAQAGTCLLLYGFPLSDISRARLEIMRQTNDGFLIAEEDLKLRGGGDVLGTKQSGLPEFKLADFISNPDRTQELLSLANKEAWAICQADPPLKADSSKALHILLRLFERDNALKYSRS